MALLPAYLLFPLGIQIENGRQYIQQKDEDEATIIRTINNDAASWHVPSPD